jgi:hypothetical protein
MLEIFEFTAHGARRSIGRGLTQPTDLSAARKRLMGGAVEADTSALIAKDSVT